ncbi:hypothetical protein L861_01925 [Litchfieldella anticariensis FP35 = DSM 16096]|uniref:T6SS Phospholipase effector Tle1-like catalytic domain-containing protein n=1 Tax=Litchfieldella anticariensis (strain DSM 16096 / CECT 5854 / CIP 108499 / LMG 22089 / FP35) TaxID=1121939 RepID=S2KQC8_LITA3|nr:DUF2235 domain-containing protein [Halomonas anticariensis]EPC04090.1 hypothetical protein L861_01925 [Halomonas anticariensis FP35 = DSM 16096]
MTRNLVVCCDGTSNQFDAINTNVVHLFSRLIKDDETQLTHYEPGVGSFPAPGRWGPRMGITLGKLFGYGITQNIENSYRFLMKHYQPGDRIFLFGFSRGAYTVRCLAGMLYKCGLLYSFMNDMVPYTSRLYLEKNNEAAAEGYKNLYGRPCPVHLVGIWDTVDSLGYLYTKRRFFNAKLNEEVSFGYHALAIDERRPKFEPLLWDESLKADHQTIEQVWFPGSHADVGGGYAMRGLAEISLQWMVERAKAQGLRFNEDIKPLQPADPTAMLHDSLATPGGRMLKWLHLGARPRMIPEGALIHEGVDQRLAHCDYQPSSLPGHYITVAAQTPVSTARVEASDTVTYGHAG